MMQHTVNIEPVVGYVVSSRGTSPGPRQSIYYTVVINTSTGYETAEDVQPTGRAWWVEQGIDTVAAPPHSLVIGAKINGVLQLHFVGEGPRVGPCP
jgi:hypothetical protein